VLGYARAADTINFEIAAVRANATGKPAALTYTVRPGDTLSSIAQERYGSKSRWPALWKQNEREIGNPDRIFAGEVLVIDPVRNVTIRVIDAAKNCAHRRQDAVQRRPGG
jgi:nucleoid-associated protein YgaU